MSVKLNKVMSELNICKQTAVEFLEKRPYLGEVKADLNFRINEAQYEALVANFKQDADKYRQIDRETEYPKT